VGKIKSELSSLEGDEMTQISGLFNREEGAHPLQHKNFHTYVSVSFLKCCLCFFARVAVLIRYCKDPDPICYLEFIPPETRIISLFQRMTKKLSFFAKDMYSLFDTVQGAGCFL
jgi:hypothetical protein